jgi:hypothetical protein
MHNLYMITHLRAITYRTVRALRGLPGSAKSGTQGGTHLSAFVHMEVVTLKTNRHPQTQTKPATVPSGYRSIRLCIPGRIRRAAARRLARAGNGAQRLPLARRASPSRKARQGHPKGVYPDPQGVKRSETPEGEGG